MTRTGDDARVRRLLTLLAREGARMVLDAGGEAYRVVEPGGAVRSGAKPVSPGEVRRLASNDWIAREAGRWRITPAGYAWLRRQATSGDAYGAQHREHCMETISTPGAGARPVTVNACESPLAWLTKRKDRNGRPFLSPPEFAAGERLRADFTFAQMGPRVTMSLVESGAGGGRRQRGASSGPEVRENVLAAKQRVVRALEAAGPDVAGLLIDVCCHLNGLEDTERLLGWPQRSGKVVLRMGLGRLAVHYGLVSEQARFAPIARRLRHWGAQDYRPHADGAET